MTKFNTISGTESISLEDYKTFDEVKEGVQKFLYKNVTSSLMEDFAKVVVSEKIDVGSTLIPTNAKQDKSLLFAIQVKRTHYTKGILNNLDWLSENHEVGNPESMPYFSDFFKLIQEYTRKNYQDPFSSFLIALFDGLVINEAYLNYEKELYSKIIQIISDLNNKEIDFKMVDKSIHKLEELGLNVIPY